MITTRIKWAAAVTGVGLLIQLGAALRWTPATFIMAAAVGVPLVLVGGVMFLAAIWSHLKDWESVLAPYFDLAGFMLGSERFEKDYPEDQQAGADEDHQQFAEGLLLLRIGASILDMVPRR